MNIQLFHYFNNFAGLSVLLDTAIIFTAEYLGYWLALSAVIFLSFLKDKKEQIIFLFCGAASVFFARIVITETIRYFYYSPRPFVALGDIYQLVCHSVSGSFPSGHATILFALATAVFFFNKKWSILFFLGAILVGVARIIAGIHWPIDILAGAIVGILSAFIVKVMATLRFLSWLQKRLE